MMNDPGRQKLEKVEIIGVCGHKIGFGWERKGGGGGGARLRGEGCGGTDAPRGFL